MDSEKKKRQEQLFSLSLRNQKNGDTISCDGEGPGGVGLRKGEHA